MKSDNESSFTCTMFKECISAFLDDELPDGEKFTFLQHAKNCSNCEAFLTDCKRLKNYLGTLKPVHVSNNFDSKLKSQLAVESVRLESPLYRLKLYIQDSMNFFTVAPVVVGIVLITIFSHYDEHLYKIDQPGLAYNETTVGNNENVNLSGEEEYISEEIIHYVLDTVKQSDAESGIFLNESANSQSTSSQNANITWASY